MILAIDFDNVIHDQKNPISGRKMGGPIIGAKEALENFKRRGDTIIIFSVSAGQPRFIADWMKYYNIPYDTITNIKPNADIFVDDKAIHFTNWKDIHI